MAQMNKKNSGINAAVSDLGMGIDLKVQVDDQVEEQKKRMKQQQPLGKQFGPAAMDLLGQGAGGGSVLL
jgi:hypothetical protein